MARVLVPVGYQREEALSADRDEAFGEGRNQVSPLSSQENVLMC